LNPNKSLALVEEHQLRLMVNGEFRVVFSCTPASLRELVAGYLAGEGLIRSLEDLTILEESDSLFRVEVPKEPFPDRIPSPQIRTDCAVLRELAAEMFSRAEIYKKGGGIHCAALTDGRRLLAFQEDIGRQNALDKVVGEALFAGLDPSTLGYISSGRINIEIMEKVKHCGFPLVVSRSLVSTLAYEEAKKHRIALIGRIPDPSPMLYNPLGIGIEPADTQKFA